MMIFGKVERKKIYKKAFDKWGMNLQLTVLMEELAELIQATSKVIREGDKKTSVWRGFVEEIADVEIMIEQIKTCVDWENLQYRVDIEKHDKLKRLKKVLDDEKICGCEILISGLDKREGNLCKDCIYNIDNHCKFKKGDFFDPNLIVNPAVECSDYEAKK